MTAAVDAPTDRTPEEGTVMRPDVLRGYAVAAGFGQVTTLPIEDDVFRFYRLEG
jgi:hypothetical protein